MSVDDILGTIEGWVHDPGSWLNSNAKQEMRELLEEFQAQSRIPPGTHFDLVIKGYTKGDGRPIRVGYVDPLANFKEDMEDAEAAAAQLLRKSSEKSRAYLTGTDSFAKDSDKIDDMYNQFKVFHPMPESIFLHRGNLTNDFPVAVYNSRPRPQESFTNTLKELADIYPAKQVIKENPISFEILYMRQIAGQFAREVGQKFVDKLVERIRELEPSCNHENLMSKFAHRLTISTDDDKRHSKKKQVWLEADPEKPTDSVFNAANLLFEFDNRTELREFGNTLTFIFS